MQILSGQPLQEYTLCKKEKYKFSKEHCWQGHIIFPKFHIFVLSIYTDFQNFNMFYVTYIRIYIMVFHKKFWYSSKRFA